jgi:hypothetical protein
VKYRAYSVEEAAAFREIEPGYQVVEAYDGMCSVVVRVADHESALLISSALHDAQVNFYEDNYPAGFSIGASTESFTQQEQSELLRLLTSIAKAVRLPDGLASIRRKLKPQ